jgi:hypothetical protein
MASSLPPNSPPEQEASRSETPKEDEDDYNGDELPYLRGTREKLAVSIPVNGTSAASKRRLSPVSASFIDLSYDDSYIDEDEALARKLAEEEEAEAALRESQQSQASQAPSESNISRNTSVSSTTGLATRSELPTYNDAVSTTSASRRSTFVSEVGSAGPPSRRSTLVPEARVVTPTRNERANVVRNHSVNSVASEPVQSTSSQPDVHLPSDSPKAVALQHDEPQRVIGRVSSMSALPSPGRLDDEPPQLSDDELATPTNHMSLNPKAVHLTAANSNDVPSGPSSVGVLNANHFVDAELLHGVCMSLPFHAAVNADSPD